jgi:tripartite-type tricarboxylate transporter receptor subunit TctC
MLRPTTGKNGEENLRHHRILFPLATAAMLLGTVSASSQSVEEFYKGKTLKIVVGNSAGGGTDLNARMLGRYIGKYIPGNPRVVIENMPGASSMKSVQYLDNGAPTDGTVITAFNPGLVTESLTKPDQIPVRLTEYSWVGSISQEIRVCYLRRELGVNTFEEMLKHPGINYGETGKGSASYIDSQILKDLFGVKVKSILGYPGGAERKIAIERGELDGECTSFSSVPYDWVMSGRAKVILHSSKVLLPGMKKETPYITDLIKDPVKKQIIEFLHSPAYLGRPYIMSKAVPADRVQAIRRAFDAAIKDKEMIAEAEKLQLPIVGPLTGEDAAAYVAEMYKSPPEVVSAARRITE